MPVTPSIFDSPDHLAIVRAVCEDPSDDLPRLAYADWAEENGFAKLAEFIRESIRLERGNWLCPMFMFGCGENLDTVEKMLEMGCLKCREWAKLKMHVSSLAASFTIAAGEATFTYSCGFADGVTMERRQFFADAANLFSCQPILRVVLTGSFSPLPYLLDNRLCCWYRSDEPHPGSDYGRSIIPPRLYEDDEDCWRLHLAGTFLTAELAMNGFSDACVRYGRRLAGLPILSV